MDIADRAQLEAEQIGAIERRASVKKADRLSAYYCAFCGEPIPEARRLAVPGCRLCIDCQTERECG